MSRNRQKTHKKQSKLSKNRQKTAKHIGKRSTIRENQKKNNKNVKQNHKTEKIG